MITNTLEDEVPRFALPRVAPIVAASIAAILASALLGGVATAALSGNGVNSNEPPPLPPQAAAQPSPSLPGGGLSADNKLKAKNRLAKSPFIKEVLKEERLKVTEEEPWYDAKGETLIGVVLTVVPKSKKSTAELDWPGFRYETGKELARVATSTKMKVKDLSSLTVFVDLRSDSIVGVEPDAGASRELSADSPTYAPTGE